MELESALEKLGLSDKAARVYLAGLMLGPSSVKALSIKARVKRTTIYEVIEALKERCLFTETVKKKKRLYVALHPNQFKVNLNDQNRVLETVFQELDKLSRTEKGKPNVLYHDSLEAIHRVYEDGLKRTKKETIGFGSPDIAQKLDEKWLDGYVKKRKHRGISARTIVDSRSQKWQSRDTEDKRKIRIMPGERELPVNIEVFDDMTLITSLKGETFGLSIESRKVSAALKSLFETVWNASEEQT